MGRARGLAPETRHDWTLLPASETGRDWTLLLARHNIRSQAETMMDRIRMSRTILPAVARMQVIQAIALLCIAVPDNMRLLAMERIRTRIRMAGIILTAVTRMQLTQTAVLLCLAALHPN